MFFSRPILMILGLGLVSGQAMMIDTYTEALHDRFANNGSFIAKTIDLSGVAITESAPFLTLVHPNVALSAIHYGPQVGTTVRFRLDNDPNGPFVERTVSQRIRAGTSDLLICILNEPVTEQVAVYGFATETLSGDADWKDHYRYADEAHLHIGRSRGSYALELDMAVGQNKLDHREIAIEVSGTTGTTVECTRDSSGTANFLPGETMGEGGDSSGPLLYVETDNSLTVVGIAWYITGTPSTGFTAVGDYSAHIQSAIDTHGQPYQPLPPTNLQVDWDTGTDVLLSWTDASGLETGYEVERAEDTAGPWTPLSSLPTDASGYSDTAAGAQQWVYRVRSVHQGVGSDWVQATLPLSYSVWASTINWSGAPSGPLEDANADSVTNLAAFGFALSPLDAAAGSLPTIQSSGANLLLEYRKNPDASHLEFRFRHSPTLDPPNWQDVVVDGVTITETEIGPEGDAILMRITVPQSEVSSPVYFRFEIEDP